MRWFSWTLVLIGLILITWFGLQWLGETKSIKTYKEVQRSESHKDPVEIFKFPRDYEKGEHVADLIIPVIEKNFNVYWGTDEETLDKGVGIYVSQWTETPEKQKHTVLSGHRNTVFSELGDVETGDIIKVRYRDTTYEYEVHGIWITDADDRTVIVKKDEAILTLTTCYPFNYIGSAPDRYIIQSKLVNQY